MSTDKHTEAPPLDPHTLRVVIERLGERITHAETERENDASEGLPADEMADWDTRIEALELARWDIENIAKTADPRARVVVLPEAFTDRVDVKHWHLSFGSVVSTARFVSFSGSRLDDMTHAEAAEAGAKLIAASAAEFAGGAQ